MPCSVLPFETKETILRWLKGEGTVPIQEKNKFMTGEWGFLTKLIDFADSVFVVVMAASKHK